MTNEQAAAVLSELKHSRPASPAWDDVQDAIDLAIAALRHSQAGGAVELVLPVCHGMRRKGTEAIIGIIPNKIVDRPATRAEYLRDYEEVPLYAHPPTPASEAVRELVGKWRDVQTRMLASGLKEAADAVCLCEQDLEDAIRPARVSEQPAVKTKRVIVDYNYNGDPVFGDVPDVAAAIAEPVACKTCSGHGRIDTAYFQDGQLIPDSDPCPDCAIPASEFVALASFDGAEVVTGDVIEMAGWAGWGGLAEILREGTTSATGWHTLTATLRLNNGALELVDEVLVTLAAAPKDGAK